MDPHAEWLEADALGGFASGTASGVRTRRYHALLLHARRPPTEPPHTPRGCPFQAWSLGELLRLGQRVLVDGSRVEPGRG